MHAYYYGVQTAFSYILNHFFYDAKHYTYLSAEYYPYKRKNPRSSNPHRAYEDLYEPWKDKDEFSKVINQIRINIKNGILAQTVRGVVPRTLSAKLGRICDEIDCGLFYPFIFRVDIKTINSRRLVKAGSGKLGSMEYLIPDLKESEINDVLFLDHERDVIIKNLVKHEFMHFRKHRTCSVGQNDVLKLLEDRAKQNVNSKRLSVTSARSSSKTP